MSQVGNVHVMPAMCGLSGHDAAPHRQGDLDEAIVTWFAKFTDTADAAEDFGFFEFSKPCMIATISAYFYMCPLPHFLIESPQHPLHVALQRQQMATVVFFFVNMLSRSHVPETKI